MRKLKTSIVAAFLLAALPAVFFADKADYSTTATLLEFYVYVGLAIVFTVITGFGLAELLLRCKQYLFNKA